MLFEDNAIFNQYVTSQRIRHNIISEKKCCIECGSSVSKEEADAFILEQTQEDDDPEHEKFVASQRPIGGKPNGYVIYEGRNQHGEFACICTGLINTSKNIKTGPMVQIFMIAAKVHPVTAIQTGENSIVCWKCKHKPATAAEKAKGIKGGACYVDVAKSVAQVYKAYKKGCYPNVCGEAPQNDDLDSYLQRGSEKLKSIFSGRKVRFGAYGEPVLIPFPIVKIIAEAASGHTGYTHRWQEGIFLNSGYKNYFMASADSEEEYAHATKNGWRTFRVVTEWKLQANEMVCLNSWQNKSCYDCLQCNGAGRNLRNIVIKVHGKSKSRFTDPSASTDTTSTVISNFGEDGDNTVQYDPNDDANPEQTKAKTEHSASQKLQIAKSDEIEEKETAEKKERRALSNKQRKEYMNRNIYRSPSYPEKPESDKYLKTKSKRITKRLGSGELE